MVELNHPTADVYVPDGVSEEAALARTTHLCVGAHQDDIEIMAYQGIAECYQKKNLWFAGVTVTNGSGSPRTGIYGDFTDEEMMEVRKIEQRKAAFVGGYSIQFQLGYPSSAVKTPPAEEVVADLHRIFLAAEPRVVYLHNPADKHETHVACMARALRALRMLPQGKRPEKVLGCEIWRDLDWLPDDEKVTLDVSERGNLAAALLGIFDSQIAGGKRYDLATQGRRLADATFFASHAVDETQALTFAMDLTPLLKDPGLSLVEYTLAAVDRFKAEVRRTLDKLVD